MHSNMHLLHLHVTAVIAPPSPLPPVCVGNLLCKASSPVPQRGVHSCLAGSSVVVCMEAEKNSQSLYGFSAAVPPLYESTSCLQDLQLPALHLQWSRDTSEFK